MKCLIPAAAAALLFSACHSFGLDHPFGRPRREVEGTLPAGGRAGPDARTLWLTGVEFPESYDWERDTAYGTVSCRLVLFNGGERVLTLPAGPGTEISPDPDMHRVIGGHLFTDGSTDTETVVREDGAERFRFPGRETVRGMLVRDGHIHTLGERRDGSGFAYRVDGVEVFSRDAGYLLPGGTGAPQQDGPLYVDGGKVCFSYAEPGLPPSVFLVRAGKAEAVETDPDAAEVLDQRLLDGVLYRVEMRTHVYGRPFLVSGAESVLLSGEPRLSPRAEKCRLLFCDGEALVRGWYRYPDGTTEFVLWDHGGVVYRESQPVQAFSLAPGRQPVCVVGLPSGLQIRKGEQSWTPVGRYRLLAPEAGAKLVDGVFHVALSGPSCILWKDGVVTPVQLHGYLSGVYVE